MPQHSDCTPTVPIKAYRALHNLPPTFGIAQFEPKDYTDLARIDHAAAGAALNDLRRSMIAHTQAVADKRPLVSAWVSAVDDLTHLFAKELAAINAVVGLRPNELDFAIGGFYDVCKAWSFAMLRPAPRKPFDAVYTTYLNESVRTSSMVYRYSHAGTVWQVQIISGIYGRCALLVRRSAKPPYDCVYDTALACPAEHFMGGLLADVAAVMGPITT
jgi:hypothetical protein